MISNPEKKDKQIHLAVHGDAAKIKEALKSNGGTFKYSFFPPPTSSGTKQEISFITIPAKNISSFAKNDFVERIEFNGGRPALLNDTMKVNMNVNAVHLGQQPLLQAYDGTGVLLGIIDAGIDPDHPDFLDSSGKSRVLVIWDQTLDASSPGFNPNLVPQPFNYGQVWDNSAINFGYHNHVEQSEFYGHGSHVSGIAAGDGSADSIPLFKGMAPNADIVVVSSDFYSDDWLQTIADAVTYISYIADSLNKPCVINISAGTYSGSHDGKDAVGLYINNLITSNTGRAKNVVCAAGNAGELYFHLRTSLASNAKFTWFKENEDLVFSSYAPDGAVYFELFSDTADFNNITFSFSADKKNPYELRGTSNSYYIKNLFNGVYTLDYNGVYKDLLKNSSGDLLAEIYFGAELINNGETYLLYVLLNPDSGQYYYRLNTSGTGKFDVWSAPFLYASDMVLDSLPSLSEFPDIVNYNMPDNAQTIVSSFSCAPDVITVGNYTNRYSYTSYQGIEVFTDTIPPLILPGMIFPSSSKGPTRDGRYKPDIAAPGAEVLSAAPLNLLTLWKNINDKQLGQGGFHSVKNGTSMASPAVAGLACLYFQKCPDAPYSDFYDALISTAKIDGYTGSVPNNIFGFGKADAFEALKSSNFSAALSNPATVFCPGSVKLTIDSNYSSQQWSTGATGISATVSQSGNYFATVSNLKGCKARTDTVEVTIDSAIVSPSIIITGDPYFCNGDSVNLSYPDTFVAYSWNNGNTTSAMFVKTTDFYRVTATAGNGCNYPSDSVLAWAMQSLPEPTITQNGNILSSSPASLYQWYFNGTEINGETNDSLIFTQSGFYQVEVFHANGCATLSDSLYAILTGIRGTEEKDSGILIFPNPNNGNFILKLFLPALSQGTNVTELTIQNILGESIYSTVFMTDDIRIELTDVPPGIYFVKIIRDRHTGHSKMLLEK